VHDLFSPIAKENNELSIPVLYSDKDISISTENAYVFKKENESNHFDALDLAPLLEQVGEKSDVLEADLKTKTKVKVKTK
jgi:hypothetical protein